MGASLDAPGVFGNTNPNLEVVIGKMMYPTPNSRDWKGKTNCNVVKASGNIYGETLPDTVGRLMEESFPTTDGQSFRLSPLFTEEMMGFPFGWTTFPFLSQSGETNPSKPTETQSSRK